MGIGPRIKEARNILNLTQEELARRLGVTKGAIANYEIETSHPKEAILYKLIEVLNVDANYLFQDAVNISKQNDISLGEFKIIEKYRCLDSYGKDMVDTVLNKEYKRYNAQFNNDTERPVIIKTAAFKGDGVKIIRLTRDENRKLKTVVNNVMGKLNT